MIEISCPQCNTELEIDEGFAGGICRCFNCGALMTVPDDPEIHAAEYLTQPGRPDQPQRPDTPGYRQPEAPTGPQTFVTNTGREVRVTEQQMRAIPTARKRRVGVRVTVIAIFVLVIVAIGASIAVLINEFLKDTPDRPDPVNVIGEVQAVTKNPFLAKPETPTLLAVENPGSPVVVIVDGSRAMDTQLYHILDLYVTNLDNLPGDTQTQLYVAGGGRVRSYPQSLSRVSGIDRDTLFEAMRDERPTGTAPLQEAFSAAALQRPQTIILVIPEKPDLETLAQMQRIATDIRAKVYVLHLQLYTESSDPDLDAFTNATGGIRIPLETGNLQRWQEEWDRTRDP